MVTALTQPTPELLRAEIKKARALLTTPTTPIGVNLTVIPAFKDIDHMAYAQHVMAQRWLRVCQRLAQDTRTTPAAALRRNGAVLAADRPHTAAAPLPDV